MQEHLYPYMQNRELSWLRFNQRVLEEAADPSVPIFERLKFLAVFTSNLDEFFMVRVGSLKDMELYDPKKIDQRTGMNSQEQLSAIYEQTRELYAMRDTIYKELNKTMLDLQMSNVSWKSLSKKQKKYFTRYFEDEILPLLSPQIMDFHHPFPHLNNKQLYIFIELMEKDVKKYGIIPIPVYLERIYPIPDMENNFLLLEQVIYHNVDRIFTQSSVINKTTIRVTRNADISLNEESPEDEDYRNYVKKVLKKRPRLAPLRLEIYRDIHPSSLNYLCEHLNISKSQVFLSKIPLDLKYVFSLIAKAPDALRSTLTYPPFESQGSKRYDPSRPLIPQILHHDILLNYPYQDVGIFLKLLKEAAVDPNVVSIKITIYRLASPSKVLEYLIRALDNGKEVTVLMELRARFDEDNNIKAAEWLEEAGCNVIYGFEQYKVHSKICLITYKTKRETRWITQIGTGNYNEKTARQYTDYCYMSARNEIGQDAVAFFQNMLMSNVFGKYERLLVSPVSLKKTVIEQLDEQIERAKQGLDAQALFKINSITDIDIIQKISEASQSGVKIILIVRGICCILPQVPGYTENLQIFSIVGRFLEHSRIYIFGPLNACKVYIASADFMSRNTERRVEVAVPILDPALKQEVIDYYQRLLKDNTKRRELQSDGTYKTIDVGENGRYDSQEEEIEWAKNQNYIPEKTSPTFTSWLRRFLKKK